jgi:DNA ligase-associated metallophosphoesterase
VAELAGYNGVPAHDEDMDLAGAALCADVSGVLYWPRQRLLCVADLHFEKGSSFARHGRFLPPYDTCATLARLGQAIDRYDPRIVICLGDNFHDGDGPTRLTADDRNSLLTLQRGRDWIWIAGNHDPDPAIGIGGRFCDQVRIGEITFRHEPSATERNPEIAGHLHPVARVASRGRMVSRKCFASNGQRMVMPAFGAFTGGLNVRHHAFASVFEGAGFIAHMLGTTRLYAVSATRCLPD